MRCRATLPELFAAQVARSPDAVAVIFEEERLATASWTGAPTGWRIICGRAGWGLETVVGLCLARSLDLIVGLLGILKAGGAICRSIRTTRRRGLPSCWRMPARRCSSPRMRCWSGCRRRRQSMCRSSCGSMPMPPPLRRRRRAPPPSRSTRPHPAYVIYTSGSTGTPKGVVVAHLNHVANAARSAGDALLSMRAICRICRLSPSIASML